MGSNRSSEGSRVSESASEQHFALPDDHPGFSDPAYRRRRAAIAEVGDTFQPGQRIPDVEYTHEEDEVWRTVAAELGKKHDRYACGDYLEGKARLGLRRDRVPQLQEVSDDLQRVSGFRIRGARAGADQDLLRLAGRPHVHVDAVHPPPLSAVLHAGARRHP